MLKANHFMKITYLLLSIFIISSCAVGKPPPKLTAAGSKVIIATSQPRGCVYLGELTGYHMLFEWGYDILNMAKTAKQAFKDGLRNKAATMKANTVVELFKSKDAGMITYVYAVQRCKS